MGKVEWRCLRTLVPLRSPFACAHCCSAEAKVGLLWMNWYQVHHTSGWALKLWMKLMTSCKHFSHKLNFLMPGNWPICGSQQAVLYNSARCKLVMLREPSLSSACSSAQCHFDDTNSAAGKSRSSVLVYLPDGLFLLKQWGENMGESTSRLKPDRCRLQVAGDYCFDSEPSVFEVAPHTHLCTGSRTLRELRRHDARWWKRMIWNLDWLQSLTSKF